MDSEEIYRELHNYAASITPSLDTGSRGILYISYFTAEDLVDELYWKYIKGCEYARTWAVDIETMAKSHLLFDLYMEEVRDNFPEDCDTGYDLKDILAMADDDIQFLRQEDWCTKNNKIPEMTVGDEFESLQRNWNVVNDKVLYGHENDVFGHCVEPLAKNSSRDVLRGVRPRPVTWDFVVSDIWK